MDETKAPKVIRLVPPKEMFLAEDKPVLTHNIERGQLTTPTYHVHFPEAGGVLSYEVGNKYPKKAWPFREALFAIDSLKRVIINIADFLNFKLVRPFLVLFLLMPNKWKIQIINKAVEKFSDLSVIVFDRWGRIMDFSEENGNSFGLSGVIWKPQFYCDMVREFRRVGMEMAGENVRYQQLVEAFCMILEFDDAYRYMIQDGFGEMKRENLDKNLSKELVRVFRLVAERGPGTGFKFNQFIKLIPLVFRLKIFRNVITEFFTKVNIQKMALDEVDFYRCCAWGGYKFRGIPDEERISMRMMIDAEWNLREKQGEKLSPVPVQ